MSSNPNANNKRHRAPSQTSFSSSTSTDLEVQHPSKASRTLPTHSESSSSGGTALVGGGGGGGSAAAAVHHHHPLLCTLPPTCNRRPTPLASTRDLETHYATYHAHVCEQGGCGAVFPDGRLLELHQTECHDPLAAVRKERGEKIFTCHLVSCGRQFSTPKTRRMHLIQAHGYPKEYFFAVTNKGVGGLLKRWGEGASMIRGEWKPRGGGGSVDEESGSEGGGEEESESESEDGIEVDSTDRVHPVTATGKTKGDDDEGLDGLVGTMGSLALVPPSIRFGRGGKKGGFLNYSGADGERGNGGRGRRGRGRGRGRGQERGRGRGGMDIGGGGGGPVHPLGRAGRGRAGILNITMVLPGLKLISQGKVRDVYATSSTEHLLFVATDRISAYDVVLKNGIPDKGKMLTTLSKFWFEKLRDIIPNHFVTADIDEMPEEVRVYKEELEGRAMLVRKAEVVPMEAIVRGYITGSAWAEYKKTGTVHGIRLREGLLESEKLEEPLFTPSTKAVQGAHDENISPEQASKLIGEELYEKISRTALELYKRAAEYTQTRGVILADTKFEFGLVGKEVILIDEVLTPDSSRYWGLEGYVVGKGQASFDKQYVRDWLVKEGFRKGEGEGKDWIMDDSVIKGTRERYQQVITWLVIT